ncbi:MAG: response regulator [Deltaproteobacteria bacterium HGW-Deltaproteobacteria-15]|jgi:two-component system phosphate regulon response regulator PhoB/two-component system alkaline phosphatase synthesis response regulator PhoP/two-component system response regulator VicR|nr:MAG: response regulator [Deltaproteobacteria bacterium HGW-Deltaproteobacteria-15]
MAIGTDILMIDDDRDLVQSIRIVLESRNYTVRSAFSGKDGYARIQEKTPNLIILDVMMATDTEGFDLAYKLRHDPRYQSIPIIMVTAFPKKMAEEGPDKFQHILGESWPVSQFIEKPVDPELLLSSVDNVLREAQKI